MHKLLQVDFPFNGPYGEEMAEALNDLALSITEEPGFIRKIWTEKESLNKAGGIYLFESEETADAYLKKHTARLKGLGVPEVRGRIYDINIELSKVTKSPIALATLPYYAADRSKASWPLQRAKAMPILHRS